MRIPGGRHGFEQEIKKSRFVAILQRISSPEEAPAVVKELSDHKATHNTWAWRIGGEARYSDDGEVGGTAGRPILSVLEQADVDQALLMVTRYYGGVHLGRGGLTRAYRSTAAACLAEAPIEEVIETTTARVHLEADLIGVLYQVLDAHPIERLDETWSETELAVTVRLPAASLAAFRDALREASRDRIKVDVIID